MSETRRLILHEELCRLLRNRNVYFSPPESIKLQYPCIIYNQRKGDYKYSNNNKYLRMDGYNLLCIYSDPTYNLVDILEDNFQYCELDRYYVANNLNHANLILYY